MKEIKELILITQKHTFSEANIVNNLQSDELEHILLQKIIQNEVKNDQEACKEIYKEEKINSSYRTLKHRLKERLHNQLLFIESDKLQEDRLKKAQYECSRLYTQAHGLYVTRYRQLAKKRYKKCLALAKAYEFTHMASICVNELINIALLERNTKENKYYETETEQLQKTIQEEIRVRNLAARFLLMIVGSVAERNEALQQAPELILKLKASWKDTLSNNIFLYYYKVQLAYWEYTNNFEKILTVTIDANLLIKRGKINELLFSREYNNYMYILSLYKVEKYTECVERVSTYLKALKVGAPNYFLFEEILILAYIHLEAYKKAAERIIFCQQQTTFQKASPQTQKLFDVYLTYASYMADELDLKYFTQVSQYFNKFLLKRKIINLAIYNLEILICLEERDFSLLKANIDTLYKFYVRYFRTGQNQRLKIWMKLIRLILRNDFNYEVIIAKAKASYEELKKMPVRTDEAWEAEIVPYQLLWKKALEKIYTHTEKSL